MTLLLPVPKTITVVLAFGANNLRVLGLANDVLFAIVVFDRVYRRGLVRGDSADIGDFLISSPDR